MRLNPGFIVPASISPSGVEYELTWTSQPADWVDAGTGATPTFDSFGMHCTMGESVALYNPSMNDVYTSGTAMFGVNIATYPAVGVDFTASYAFALGMTGNVNISLRAENGSLQLEVDGGAMGAADSILLSNIALTAGLNVIAITWDGISEAILYWLQVGGAVHSVSIPYTASTETSMYHLMQLNNDHGNDPAFFKTYVGVDLVRSSSYIQGKATSWGWA